MGSFLTVVVLLCGLSCLLAESFIPAGYYDPCEANRFVHCAQGTYCVPTVPDSCSQFPCKANAVCGYFGGSHSSCSSSPCQNGGTCFDTDDSYVCLCRFAFGGRHCQNYVGTFCESSPCQNGNTCSPLGSWGYRC